MTDGADGAEGRKNRDKQCENTVGGRVRAREWFLYITCAENSFAGKPEYRVRPKSRFLQKDFFSNILEKGLFLYFAGALFLKYLTRIFWQKSTLRKV